MMSAAQQQAHGQQNSQYVGQMDGQNSMTLDEPVWQTVVSSRAHQEGPVHEALAQMMMCAYIFLRWKHGVAGKYGTSLGWGNG